MFILAHLHTGNTELGVYRPRLGIALHGYDKAPVEVLLEAVVRDQVLDHTALARSRRQAVFVEEARVRAPLGLVPEAAQGLLAVLVRPGCDEDHRLQSQEFKQPLVVGLPLNLLGEGALFVVRVGHGRVVEIPEDNRLADRGAID